MNAADSEHSTHFVSTAIQVLQQVPVADIDAVVDVLVATKARGGRLFFVGSGGGAGHASHATFRSDHVVAKVSFAAS